MLNIKDGNIIRIYYMKLFINQKNLEYSDHIINGRNEKDQWIFYGLDTFTEERKPSKNYLNENWLKNYKIEIIN